MSKEEELGLSPLRRGQGISMKRNDKRYLFPSQDKFFFDFGT